MTPWPGKCRHCLRSRPVYAINRTGGGSYNRAPRTYSSSICGECAAGLVEYLGTHSMATQSRFSGNTLIRIAEIEAPEVAEAWKARKEEETRHAAR